MAIVKPKTNPECYINQGAFAASTSTADAIDFGFNCHYLRVENISDEEVYVRFGSTAATTDDYPLSTGDVFELTVGPLCRDLSVSRNTTTTDLSGLQVIALGA